MPPARMRALPQGKSLPTAEQSCLVPSLSIFASFRQAPGARCGARLCTEHIGTLVLRLTARAPADRLNKQDGSGSSEERRNSGLNAPAKSSFLVGFYYY